MQEARSLTADGLDLPHETLSHMLSMDVLEEDDVAIVYAVKPDAGDGKAELVKVKDKYRVTFTHHPPDPDDISMLEREWFDNLGDAVDQMATWMMGVDIEDFLDEGGGA